MPLFCMLLSVALTLLGLAWGVILLVALPRGLWEWLLGSLWRPAYPFVLSTTFFITGLCANVGAAAWMHALAAAGRSLRAAVITSTAYLVGALVGGALGSIRGAAPGSWIGVLAYGGRCVRRYGSTTACRPDDVPADDRLDRPAADSQGPTAARSR